jgi:hypothetical protein
MYHRKYQDRAFNRTVVAPADVRMTGVTILQSTFPRHLRTRFGISSLSACPLSELYHQLPRKRSNHIMLSFRLFTN